jgi:hypothetical protein
MEVHHHVHPAESGAHTTRKKWTHYFWEFLMLFLAVFCGFLAEYQLEHMIEKQKARQYISSFLQDLEIDNEQFDQLIPAFIEKDQLLDSLLRKIRGINPSTSANGIYKYYRQPFTYPDFIYTDRTIQQLKNSGGMRLIADKGTSDSITNYDASIRLLEIGITEGVKDLRVPMMLFTFKLFDLSCCPELGTAMAASNSFVPAEFDFPEPGILLTYDKKILTEYFNAVQEMKRQFAIYLETLVAVKKHNIRVRDFLQRKYRLK